MATSAGKVFAEGHAAEELVLLAQKEAALSLIQTVETRSCCPRHAIFWLTRVCQNSTKFVERTATNAWSKRVESFRIL